MVVVMVMPMIKWVLEVLAIMNGGDGSTNNSSVDVGCMSDNVSGIVVMLLYNSCSNERISNH